MIENRYLGVVEGTSVGCFDGMVVGTDDGMVVGNTDCAVKEYVAYTLFVVCEIKYKLLLLLSSSTLFPVNLLSYVDKSVICLHVTPVSHDSHMS